MVGGERGVVGGVPVLRDDHRLEFGSEPVDQRDDGVPIRDGERAAGAEIGLDVDDEQGGVLLHGRKIAKCVGWI